MIKPSIPILPKLVAGHKYVKVTGNLNLQNPFVENLLSLKELPPSFLDKQQPRKGGFAKLLKFLFSPRQYMIEEYMEALSEAGCKLMKSFDEWKKADRELGKKLDEVEELLYNRKQ